MKTVYRSALFLTILIYGMSCIGDDLVEDFVPTVVRIINPVDTIAINTSYQLSASFFDNVGRLSTAPVSWSSSAPDVISIDKDGLAQALKLGSAVITATAMFNDETPSQSITIHVGEETTVVSTGTIRRGTLKTTSSYLLQGGFVLDNTTGQLTLTLESDYKASTALPGLAVYLSNNPNSKSDALKIADVKVFEGVHSYTISGSAGLNDYSHVLYFCEPFNVKVGDGVLGDPE